MIQIFRTAFSVSDLDRSLAFYRDLLGLKVVRDKMRSGESYERLLGIPGVKLRVALLEDGKTAGLLELVQFLEPSSPPPAPPRGPIEHANIGAANVAYLVDDIASIYEKLKAAGVQSLGEPGDFVQEGKAVARVVMAFDPDHIPIVLMQKLPAQNQIDQRAS